MCPICDSALYPVRSIPWIFECPQAHYCKTVGHFTDSTLLKSITFSDTHKAHSYIGLAPLRRFSNSLIIDFIDKYFLGARRINVLDVGSGHGILARQVPDRYRVLSLEPDYSLYSSPLNAIYGFFPNCIINSPVFDVIVFGDSLEHISNISLALSSTHSILNLGGFVAISIPSSAGILYRISILIGKLGYFEPLHRLWQLGTRSPHLHYFSPHGMQDLLHIHGFDVVYDSYLPSYSIDGLWGRLLMIKNPLWFSAIVWFVLVVFSPALRLFASDSYFIIARKRKDNLHAD